MPEKQTMPGKWRRQNEIDRTRNRTALSKALRKDLLPAFVVRTLAEMSTTYEAGEATRRAERERKTRTRKEREEALDAERKKVDERLRTANEAKARQARGDS